MRSGTNNKSKGLFNTQHLEQVEETYVQHFCFATWAGFVLIAIGILSLIHAVLPFVLARYPDRLYQYFVSKSQPRIIRVNSILKSKNLE